MQVPLLRVLEEVAPVRVPGRQPLFQSWFDIQPVSFEGELGLEGLQIEEMKEVRRACAYNSCVCQYSYLCGHPVHCAVALIVCIVLDMDIEN